MEPKPLHYIWQYTDADAAFFAEHIDPWLPERIFDVHVHINDLSLRVEEMTDERRREIWVTEVAEPMSAETLDRCDDLVYPGRGVGHLAFGWPGLEMDLEGTNEYARNECVKRNWPALALLRPQWSAERVAEELAKPGVIGLKPYYALIGTDPTTRDKYIEASIFDFLPHHALEVADDRRAWITLHVPKADRLGHPDNIREIKEIRQRYPNIMLVIAHFGRCYTLEHATGAFEQLADDDGLFFDNSAVLNPAVHKLALQQFGPRRILYGTDNPVFYMRGRREWRGDKYINHTDADLHFNKHRERPSIEARYTLYMYEALRAIKQACDEVGVEANGIEAMFAGNAERLLFRWGPAESEVQSVAFDRAEAQHFQFDEDGVLKNASDEYGSATCPWCGGEDFTHGKMATYGGIGFLTDSVKGVRRMLTYGQPIRVRRCDGCGHLDLIAQME